MSHSPILDPTAPLAHGSAPETSRPDAAVIIGAADPPESVLRVAALRAADADGVLRVIHFVDLDALPRAERPARACAARSHLRDVVERYRARTLDLRVTERLHFGPLHTLVDSLEPTVGTVVVAATPDDPWAGELASSCPVPVWMTDRDGIVVTSAPA